MELHFEWQKLITLTHNKKVIFTDGDLELVDDIPGIYYFARSFGGKFEPFYFGETRRLRTRLKQHLKSAKIAFILLGMNMPDAPEISNGPRSFHFAYLKKGKGAASLKKCLGIAQRFMIREALAQNIQLLNSNLTVIKTHNLFFEGDSFFKKRNSVER